MATRRETSQQKEALKTALRTLCREGKMRPGQPAPPLRQLAEEYRLSKDVVAQSMRELIDEGLFHAVPRLGTFVGPPKTTDAEFYLLLHSPEALPLEQLHQLQTGFEERVAQRGAACLSMTLKAALECRARGEMPQTAGVFDFAYQPGDKKIWPSEVGVPRVAFAGRVADPAHSDVVSLDDRNGGMQATQHLLHMGHQQIAFLGLHAPENRRGQRTSTRIWSQLREEGWRLALEQAHVTTESLVFHAAREPRHGDFAGEVAAARETAQRLLTNSQITAVVAANDRAAWGLFDVLRDSDILPQRWPAVVGFDNSPSVRGHVISSMRLPLEELGREAADLLCDRRQGVLIGEPQHREVAMRLIPRLTSRPDWSHVAAHVALAAAIPG